ncbi:NAC transcription factor 32-like [Zingiber officinale]|uniref:NAC transcription factor 32-like n=1 Tax=Zingiber officinale TaxID=94328 RepID=UPI001C4AC010|nr:NAC transcription factor 32-like [Zingiber officinale]
MATTTGGTATAIPIGYRFLPTDKELIVDYLANRVAGKPVPSTAVIEADVYGTEPWNLLRNGDQEGYFFAMRKRKNAVGTRVDRRAGTGTWTLYSKKEESVTTLDAEGREIAVGCKSSLSFNDGKSKYSGWIMHEYELLSVAGVFQTQVLCHIKNRAGKMKKRSAADIPTTRPHESALSPECTTQTPPKRSYEAANFPSALFPECTAQPPPKRSQPHEAALFSECTEQPPAKRVCNWQLPMFLEPSPSSCDEDQAFYAQLPRWFRKEMNAVTSSLLPCSCLLLPVMKTRRSAPNNVLPRWFSLMKKTNGVTSSLLGCSLDKQVMLLAVKT